MNENPDNDSYLGLGPQRKMMGEDKEGNPIELALDQRHLIPTNGMLRFVERRETNVPEGSQVRVRFILQQYQWSAEEGDFDWYDVPLVVRD